MSVARLAARNLSRNLRRSLLTCIAVVAGVGIYVLGEGFIGGLDENIIVSAIDGTVGHVMARPKGYPLEAMQHPIDELLEVPDAARELLDRESVAWTERTLFTPLAASGQDSLRVVAIGYDPERDPKVFPRHLWKVVGTLPRPNEPEVAVSKRVARLLQLEPGKRLILQVRTHKGAINALDVTVSGVMTANNAAIDNLGVLVPRKLARTLIASELPSHLSVRLGSRNDADAFAPKLAAALGQGSEVVTWRYETADLLAVQAIRRRALEFVVFILMALAAFGIANTILMAAHERVREVGTLRSMGMTEGGVLRLFLLEGALIGLFGGLLGALWGGALVAHWSKSPIDFSQVFERSQQSLSVSALVYTRFSPSVIAGAVVLGVVISILASIYPARVASRLVPAEAVRANT
jgi:putative ABC transport system permease protein